MTANDPSRLAPQVPLPPYAYRPGLHPHPKRHSDGHMHGEVELRPQLPLPSAWPHELGHLHAVDLFNHGYWWEAHEAWESYWHAAAVGTPEHHTLQALIQFAALLLKLEAASTEAAEALRRNALMNLEAALSHPRTRGSPVLGFDLVHLATLASSATASTAAATRLPAPR